MNTMCAVSIANHLRAVADAFRLLKTKYSTLLLVKAENICRNSVLAIRRTSLL